MEKIKHNLALTLFTARKSSGLNHEEFVKISGVTRPILSGIENARLNPTLDTLVKLSESLSIDLDFLFLTKDKFEKLKQLMSHEFQIAKLNNFEILISEVQQRKLLKHSHKKDKNNLSRVINCIKEIIDYNFPKHHDSIKKKMTYNAAMGYIYQDDGFLSNMEFGIWYANETADQMLDDKT